jgi:ABC-type sugar transport system ATPase subunit
LLVDEPTRGVDVGAKTEIHKILDQMVREGKSIIVVSSEMEEVLKLSDRVLVMRAGRIVAELKKDEIKQETIIGYAMGGSNNE